MPGQKLSKAEIVEAIHPLVKVSKKNIHRVVDLFFEQIKAGLLADRVIELRGLGTFEIRTRARPQGAQPQDGRSGHRARSRRRPLPSRPGAEAEGLEPEG